MCVCRESNAVLAQRVRAGGKENERVMCKVWLLQAWVKTVRLYQSIKHKLKQICFKTLGFLITIATWVLMDVWW